MRTKGIPAAAVVVIVCAAIGGLFGGRVVATQDRATERYKLYTAALAAIETGYVEPMEGPQLIYGSIDGMLRTLDPHSSFFDPKFYAQMRERQQGSYYGLGVTIASVNGDITVNSVFEGSPAFRAGIRRQDVIATIEDHSAKGYTNEQAVAELKGQKGTKVRIGIRRAGVEGLIELAVERDEVHIVTVRGSFMVAPDVGYVRLEDFSDTSNREVTEALRRLTGEGMKRLVLDLRENPGGPLTQAILVSSQFLHKGDKVVATKGRIPRSSEEYKVEAEGQYTNLPLVVIVNRDSASASEIVSGAMQDHDRGIVVGETTFGKALVQSVYEIANRAAVALTTAHYTTPSGRVIQRPWDASFDEYRTYQQREQAVPPSHPANAEVYKTVGGLERKVYGGGGIEPDHFVPGPIEGFSPTRFSRMLGGDFVAFARRFTAEGDTRPASARTGATHKVARGWTLTDGMVTEFRKMLTDRGLKIDEAAFQTDMAFIKAEIKFEIDRELFGVEEARRHLARVDPQLQAALGYFGEAEKLLEAKNARARR
jgi:carboxyl-terminal processing protease